MTKKKLLLVLPRDVRSYFGGVRGGKAGLVRLSLPTIASLTPPDWDVTIHDSRVAPIDYDQDVDLVGITGFTGEILDAYAIADRFRAKDICVVIGGVHATALPDEALQHADAVVSGEAEQVWEGLLQDFSAGRLKARYQADEFFDMRQMRTPRRDLLNREMFSHFHTLEATRGCPHDCDYCAVTGVFGRRYRMRPVEEVVEEIRTFDSRDFFFADDNICGQPKYAKELFRRLIPLRKRWGGQTAVTFARDDELLELYARSGGRYAFVGFESLSDENLARMNKKWGHAQSYPAVIRKIHDAGINVVGSFMFGLDEDDVSVFRRTVDFVLENRIDAAQFHILTPFPGTRLHEQMDREGRIADRDWAKYSSCEVVFRPRKMTADELQQGYYWAYQQVYTYPRILMRSLRTLRGLVRRIGLNISYRNKALRMPPIPRNWPDVPVSSHAARTPRNSPATDASSKSNPTEFDRAFRNMRNDR